VRHCARKLPRVFDSQFPTAILPVRPRLGAVIACSLYTCCLAILDASLDRITPETNCDIAPFSLYTSAMSSNEGVPVEATMPQAADTTTSSSLLDLPPELRLRIYDYALISQDGFVHVTPQLKQPPLLLTSHLVRREALPIWYDGNKVAITILDCDPTLKFRAHLCACDDKEYHMISIRFRGRPHWTNLRAWCHKALRDALELPSMPVKCSVTRVISAALQVTSNVWKVNNDPVHLEALLSSVRDLAGVIDPTWLQDL